MLPQEFLDRMKKLLKESFDAFLTAVEDGKAVRGLRINTLKCERENFLANNSLPLRKVPYTELGFILNSDESIGANPEHHAGRIYMQDPGAMAPLSAIEIRKGARVVDLCAAPGGKSGQAAEMIGDEGFILSNEFVPKRAKILVGNLERLGVRNAIVTSMDTGRLADLFSEYFDCAIVDAPCSGEGMFRKNDGAAIEEWSEGGVRASAERQREILDNAARLVKEDGYIIYSTCTYSTEENEETIDSFLSRHPEFSPVCPSEKILNSTAGPITTEENEERVKYCRRFYPHISEGEGQFLAILYKNQSVLTTKVCKDSSKPLSKAEKDIVNEFFKSTLKAIPNGRAVKHGENLVLLPDSIPLVPENSVFMAGVLIGEIQKGRLIPAHQFFSAYGEFFKTRIELSKDETALASYLAGEEISAPDGLETGWCVLTYKNSSLGGGKIAGGRIKNHYPKGLRNR